MKNPMDDKQAAEAVLRWATQAYTDAVSRHTKANCEFQGNFAAKETWDSCNPDDGIGSMGTNPYTYRIEQLSKACDSTLRDQLDWKYVHDFVIRRICNLIEEKPC